MMISGFSHYCHSFFKRHACRIGHGYLKPVRMTGSAIELVFSALRQMKGAASLTEAKFCTAKANYIMQQINDPKTHNQYFGGQQAVQAQSTGKRHSDLEMRRAKPKKLHF
eukprot:Pompholyxophrys_punicea_v1_NODE_430_length_1986_cov_6.927536.p3 type:complete len:110 gc:universal NODE_430_length_1986_cov_6.927536:383-54(-)